MKSLLYAELRIEAFHRHDCGGWPGGEPEGPHPYVKTKKKWPSWETDDDDPDSAGF